MNEFKYFTVPDMKFQKHSLLNLFNQKGKTKWIKLLTDPKKITRLNHCLKGESAIRNGHVFQPSKETNDLTELSKVFEIIRHYHIT